ncbi:Domain of uncharacterised function (DUF2825) [Escherichia coli]|nr:Domain of uncharacterised function (DUF2825) [Escherichia coli]CAD5698241.1 Domain of uncharacterised function (DUF2825) [Escherichia coli]
MVVYPRWRGELDSTASVVSSGSGLSPLARGTPVFANLWTIAIRFIPAGAGNTRRLISAARDSPVYPRWRGEHAVQNFLKRFNCGLSPLARGTHTPLSNSCDLPTVYPRWRGEHYRTDCRILFFCGLSPLARGTLHGYASSQRRSRFIPAGAGNTPRLFKRGRRGSVYPRWRGEHV